MRPFLSHPLTTLLPNKCIIAIIGDANAGKTTTISKIYEELSKAAKIHNVQIQAGWNPPNTTNPRQDFILYGQTIYGETGIVSRGDQIYQLKRDLAVSATKKNPCDLILCACRENYPKTFTAVAEASWAYGYTIIWVNLAGPTGPALDAYTTNLATQIANVF